MNSSDLVVVIFDRADCGSAMELERAYVLRKTIIGYRSTARFFLPHRVGGKIRLAIHLLMTMIKPFRHSPLRAVGPTMVTALTVQFSPMRLGNGDNYK